MKNEFTQSVNHLLIKLGLLPDTADLLDRAVIIVIILLIAWVSDLFCRYVIIGGITRIIKKTKARWDDALLHPQVIRKLSYLIPAVIIYTLLPLALSDKAEILGWMRKLCIVYGTIVLLVFINIFMKVMFEIISHQQAFRNKPMKGLLQILQVALVCIGIVLVISELINISPLHLLAGLGASAAILMLVFKDSILGFVSGIQLSINDMLQAGDWISMPKYGVDGTVSDVSLTTVKIENFDNTITTIPPYILTSDSFQNWRGMVESGGRRVMRSVNIDINSVRFCTPEMLEKYKRFALVRDYIEQEEQKLEAQRAKLNLDPATTFDTLRQSNIGIFRAYLNLYLKNLAVVNHDLTCMVRQLQPTETGIPMQLYFFSSIKEWVAYEGVQADVFDHVMSVISEFDLYVFQSLSGQDLQQVLAGQNNSVAPAKQDQIHPPTSKQT